jgi:hypothetical protein
MVNSDGDGCINACGSRLYNLGDDCFRFYGSERGETSMFTSECLFSPARSVVLGFCLLMTGEMTQALCAPKQ